METNGNRMIELLSEISKKLNILEDVRSEQGKMLEEQKSMREEQKLMREEQQSIRQALIQTNQRLDLVDGSLQHLITVTVGLQKTYRDGFERLGDRLLSGICEALEQKNGPLEKRVVRLEEWRATFPREDDGKRA